MNLSHLTLIRESRRKSKTRDSHRACYRENIDRAALDPFIYHSKFQSTLNSKAQKHIKYMFLCFGIYFPEIAVVDGPKINGQGLMHQTVQIL